MSLLMPVPTRPRCETVADAAAALADARDREVEPVLDLSALDRVHVDPARRIAWVQPGALWGDLDAATQEHGLAVTGARSPGTAVADFTLASGSGWLERRLGLASDNLRAARVLTAGGRVVLASATTNPDLFWALRGGGAGFGVAVELEFALRPVGPEVLGGTLRWPRPHAGRVMRAYRGLMAGAPDALCGGLVLTPAAVEIVVLYAGDPGRGDEHLAGLRALAPELDTVRPLPYRELQALLGGEPLDAAYLDGLPDAAVDALVAAAPAAVLEPLGGAFGRVGDLDTAHGRRGAAWRVQALGDPGEAADLADALAAWTARPEGLERRARLLEARDRWDPHRVFGDR